MLTRSAGILQLKGQKRIFFSAAPAVDGSDSAWVPRDEVTGRVTTSPGDSPRLHNQRRAPLMTDSRGLCALDSVSRVRCPKNLIFKLVFIPVNDAELLIVAPFCFLFLSLTHRLLYGKTASLLQTEMINLKTFGCFSLSKSGSRALSIRALN